jgi:OOP family OmpA-OmpF porin
MKPVSKLGCVTALCLALLGWGPAGAYPKGDHPEVASYPGAKIRNFDFKEFEEAQLLLSQPKRNSAGDWVVDKVLPVDGKVTYINYEVAESVSALQLFRNYQSSLRRSGFTELFVCERPCMPENTSFESHMRPWLKARDLNLYLTKNIQYLAAQRGGTYVSLAVGDWGGSAQAYLFVIEKGQLDTGLMAVTGASPMAQALSTQGKVDVYGFLFDSGKSQLKPGSAASLAELAQVLRDNPSLQLALIGHTDDVGQADANVQLSTARAQAVALALVSEHGIDPSRLQASGQGASQPLAPNTDELARAKNRRVEVRAQAPVASPAPAAASARPVATPVAATAPAAGGSASASAGQPQPQNPQPGSPAATTPTVVDKTDKAVDTANKVLNAADKLRRLLGR